MMGRKASCVGVLVAFLACAPCRATVIEFDFHVAPGGTVTFDGSALGVLSGAELPVPSFSRNGFSTNPAFDLGERLAFTTGPASSDGLAFGAGGSVALTRPGSSPPVWFTGTFAGPVTLAPAGDGLTLTGPVAGAFDRVLVGAINTGLGPDATGVLTLALPGPASPGGPFSGPVLGGVLVLDAPAVPEPHSLALAALAAGVGVIAHARKRSRPRNA